MEKNPYRAWDEVLERMLTWEEIKDYTLEALTIPGTIKFLRFTGYQDSKKVDIYVGDIFQDIEGKRWKVYESEGTFTAWAPGKWRPLRLFGAHCMFNGEIIGNEYQKNRPLVTRVKEAV